MKEVYLRKKLTDKDMGTRFTLYFVPQLDFPYGVR